MIWFPLAVGYLLGSFLPAYFLTKRIIGVDIRTVGTHHAGTTNVYRVAGFLPALLTGTCDVLKGIVAVFISSTFGYGETISYLSGLCAIAGHVFPFYLGFRGGKGAATTVGLLLFVLWKTAAVVQLETLISDFLILLSIVLVFYFCTKKGDVIGLFVLPALAVLIAIRIDLSQSWFADTLIGILLFINLRNISQEKLFTFTEDVRPWRVYIRPLSIVLLSLSSITTRRGFLTLTGTVLSIFLTVDIIRLVANRYFPKNLHVQLYRESERGKISSMSFFLLGIFISFLLFDRSIAFLACTYVVFGDFAAKIIGMSFGKRKLFNKTVEGSLAHFTICLYAAYLFSTLRIVDFHISLIGATAATISELLPIDVNDNLSVPLFSALVMSLSRLL